MIRIPRAYADHMVAHAQEGWPDEICGLIAAEDGRLVRAFRVKNVDENPRVRYTMDPPELLRVTMEIDRRGWELYGIYHSHPATQAVPSATDRAMALDADAPRGEQARWPGAIYFIVSLQDREHPQIRAWRILEEASVEDEVAVAD